MELIDGTGLPRPHRHDEITGSGKGVGHRQEIEDFVRHILVEIEAAELAGITGGKAIADHLNAKGVTTRKGRYWTGATAAKFLSSPGAGRYGPDGENRP